MRKDRTDLLRVIFEDVDQALERLDLACTPADRRNCLRTIISAAEANSWVYRDHILALAKDFDQATPLIELAFAETSISVDEQGEIRQQMRRTSLTAMIRLITKVAQSFCPGLNVDFGASGWQSLKVAIQVRNRITHPRTMHDLLVTDSELEAAKTGFFWFLDMSLRVMEEAVKELRLNAAITRKVVDDLVAGDPDTLALYDQVYQEPE